MNTVVTFLFSILSFILISVGNLSYTQTENVQFDVSITDTIYLPSSNCMLKSIKLLMVPRDKTKAYYQSNNESLFTFQVVTDKKISIIEQKDSMCIIQIPPLEPNRIYKITYEYYTDYNIYGIFKQMHNEQLELYKDDKRWMQTIRELNYTSNFMALYQPFISEIVSFSAEISKLDLVKDSVKLRKSYLKSFEILKFREKDLDINDLIKYAELVKNAKLTQKDKNNPKIDEALSLSLSFISIVAEIPDYLRIYEFYNSYLRLPMNSPNLSTDEYVKMVSDFLNSAIISFEIDYAGSGEPIPNFYFSFRDLITESETKLKTTYSKNFETGYKRMLVPDFGYIGYIPINSDFSLTGGSPYVGTHIHFKPVNKQVPLKLSKVGVAQRLSLHVGVTLNSVAKSGSIEDFLNKNSLTIGAGYIVFSHALRLNTGVALYRKIDPITSNKTLGITPYVGLSVDIEIKTWLESSIPDFTNLFKN